MVAKWVFENSDVDVMEEGSKVPQASAKNYPLNCAQPPPKKRRLPAATEGSDPKGAPQTGGAHAAAAPSAGIGYGGQDDDERAGALPADVTCLLCRRKFSVGSFKFLNTVGPPQGGLPYFPFLTELPRPDELADSTAEEAEKGGGRVRACQSCTTSLMNQWTLFQRENIPVYGRHYTYPSLSTGPRSVSSVRAHSPASQKSQEAGAAAAAAAALAAHQQIRTRSNTLESRPRSTPHSPNPKAVVSAVSSSAAAAAPLACHSPAISGHSAVSASAASAAEEKQSAVPSPAPPPAAVAAPPAAVTSTGSASSSSFYCFLCGLHSELSFARMLYSTAPSKKAPYFPFMKSHVPKARAETLREDGTALVCTFCYHSVMVQWTRFNEGKVTDQAARTYNLNDYNCYVCGVTTYRKRIRALRVQVSVGGDGGARGAETRPTQYESFQLIEVWYCITSDCVCSDKRFKRLFISWPQAYSFNKFRALERLCYVYINLILSIRMLYSKCPCEMRRNRTMLRECLHDKGS